MLLFYVRHGDPIYRPDELTPLGRRQAEAIGRRLARYGVDKIYSSTSIRAQQTAQPLCEMLRMEKTTLEWCHENRAHEDVWVEEEDGRRPWAIESMKYRRLFVSEEMRRLGNRWYEHPMLSWDMVKENLFHLPESKVSGSSIFNSFIYILLSMVDRFLFVICPF